jgi:hypothetical protein
MEALNHRGQEWVYDSEVSLFLEAARKLLPQPSPGVDDTPKLMDLGLKYHDLIQLYPAEHLPRLYITASAHYEVEGELVVITEDEESETDYHVLCVDSYVGPIIRKQYECMLNPYYSIHYYDYSNSRDARIEPDLSSFSKPFTHDPFKEVMELLSKCNETNKLK